MSTTMKAEARTGSTKGDRKQLRAQGKIPGVVYGKKVPQTAISIDQKELLAVLKSNPHAIIDMDVPQIGKQPVMINEVQRDPLSRQLLHVDFHQINMDEPVNTTVRLEFVGDPAGVQAGGILQLQRHEVDIRCLPNQIPSAIQVDVSGLEIGDNMLVSQLALADNIEVKSDPNDVLATILLPQKEAEPEATEEEPAAKTDKTEAAEPAEETV
ncbi:50S ribosomal protein L25/general stress protein Ctc [Paenibacillus allorhizosphaerae]|uniref:Large ribosomal subunit protein bL25 n=1 Tax=Paenibacillus allorhizosphaerae TaxID=2849866 RepID=A0ABM8VSB2_9BACL|nr:50S ribosomal protein L25/general stress protein Ctc [Paenibacillus allorhizosphaerae]CAG7656327.1 General stress protein CTC [Paenibacillus allorhizosphaerae]